jgi:uncharacterized protein
VNSSNSKKPNRLIQEASPYLQQHGNNPVDWFPWGDEALEKAKQEDKPILLSIGYSACHWCHVMERESFEDEAIAQLMNAAFVNIKVDREERPDLDQIYQLVVQLMGKGGGWPLTVFLTPDQKPFYGGTYFPPQPRYGMPSFGNLLMGVKEAYDERREQVTGQAEELTQAIQKISRVIDKQSSTALGPELLKTVYEKLVTRFDDRHGGFGNQPKFPNTMALDVMLRFGVQQHHPRCIERVQTALWGMRHGGIWDHIGFGFHRYSTDAHWLVPHFEKMLYDNALLLRLYLDAGLGLEKPEFIEVSRNIASYLIREMASPEGGFYATQDADSEGEEGKFFVWNPEQIDSLFSADDSLAALVKKAFGITQGGNFEHQGQTVLFQAQSTEQLAAYFEWTVEETLTKLESARNAMFAAREQRPKPFRDEKILACWNGMLLGSLAYLGAIVKDPALVAAAEKAFGHLQSRLIKQHQVFRYTNAQGYVSGPGFLDDYANLANSALDLYEVTFNSKYLVQARELADEILRSFLDPEEAGFFFQASDKSNTICRVKDAYDNATPSGSAMAALVLLRLGTLFGNKYALPAENYLNAVYPTAMEVPLGLGQTVCVLDRLQRGAVEIVIVGAKEHPQTRALHDEALACYVPNRSLLFLDPNAASEVEFAAELVAGKDPGKKAEAVAYVCQNQRCSLPVADPEALRALLKKQ